MRGRGLSLAETILAGFVLSILMIAMFDIFPASAVAVRRAELQLQADAIAQKYLETWRSKDFADLATGPVSPPPEEELYKDVVFRPAVEVFTVPGASADYLKGVRVSVSWQYREKTFQITHEAWICNVEK
ncbi:MAG TPA: hypothetical protein VNO81_13815 [Candidatus Nitrosotenuis sp.]|jgi:Tfp pilus assembly protein PilV|nr:hypothetical protein [Candidatus Nitrosotenuis sp.]